VHRIKYFEEMGVEDDALEDSVVSLTFQLFDFVDMLAL